MRVNQNVKFIICRIELGEIEAALKSQKMVVDCAVIARDFEGGKKLVAYIKAENSVKDKNTLIKELRILVKGKLPTYMIPSYFIILDSLPINVNGKLDTKALPLPGKQFGSIFNILLKSSKMNLLLFRRNILHLELH